MSPTLTPVFDTVWTPEYQTSPAWTELNEPEDGGWLESAIRQVTELERLRQDWDSYGSGPVRREAVKAGVQLLLMAWRFLGGGPSPEIAPIGGGGIHIAFATGTRALEFEVQPLGDVLVLRLANDEPVGDDLTLFLRREEVEAALGWL